VLETEGVSGLSARVRRVAAATLRSALLSGDLPIDDRPAGDVLVDFVRYLRRAAAQPDTAALDVTIDHGTPLLEHARSLAVDERPVASAILYATWVEHWINGVLATVADRIPLDKKDRDALLRRPSMDDKLGWVWRFLSLTPLEPVHRGRVKALTDLRNSYVHYKWEGRTPEAHSQSDEQLRALVAAFPETVAYLDHYRRQHFDGRALDIVARVFGDDSLRDLAR
jgi:hypothetical protein